MKASEVKAFGFEMTAQRNLFHLALSDMEACPAHLPLFAPNFTLFAACDSRTISAAAIADFAGKMLAQGAVYICSWGPGCEQVHDIFDEAVIGHQIEANAVEANTAAFVSSHVMTTWHSDETLEDALDFFLNAATPDGAYSGLCRAAIAISIGNEVWASRIDDVMLSQVPAEARTCIYSSHSNGEMWMRNDFDEPLDDFAEYM